MITVVNTWERRVLERALTALLREATAGFLLLICTTLGAMALWPPSVVKTAEAEWRSTALGFIALPAGLALMLLASACIRLRTWRRLRRCPAYLTAMVDVDAARRRAIHERERHR